MCTFIALIVFKIKQWNMIYLIMTLRFSKIKHGRKFTQISKSIIYTLFFIQIICTMSLNIYVRSGV